MPRSFEESFSIPRTIGHGLAAVKAAPLPLILGAFLAQCTDGGGGGGGGNAFNGTSNGEQDLQVEQVRQAFEGLEIGVILLISLCVLVVLVVMFFLRCWLRPGYLRAQRDALSRGAADVATLFSGGDVFWRMVRWRLLRALVSMGTLLIAALPGAAVVIAGIPTDSTVLYAVGGGLVAVVVLPVIIYVSYGLYFGDFLVVFDDLDAMDALGRSWDAARGHRLWLLVFSVVLGLFSIAGLLLCCVGVVLTRAIAETGATEAYLWFTRPDDEIDAMWSRSQG